MRQIIERHLLAGAELADLRPRYVRYKELDGSLVGWQVETVLEGQRHGSYVTARSAALWRLVSEAERLGTRVGEIYSGLRSLALLEEEELLLLSFPVDRVLQDIRRMLRASRIRSLCLSQMPHIVPEGLRFSKRKSTVELVRYKPERRAVLRWLLGMVDASSAVKERKGIYIRIHAGALGPRVTRALQAAAEAGVRCPRPFAVPHPKLVIESELSGASPECLSKEHCAAAGELLSRLHGSEPPGDLPEWTGVQEMDSVLRACGDLDRLDGEAGRQARSIADRLSSWIPSTEKPRLLHGDFHQGQLLFDSGRAGLVDFDRAVVGNAAYDLASFHGHLFGIENADETSAALEETYGHAGELPSPRTLAWYKAAFVLRFAMTPFRTLRPDWPSCTGRMLEHAARMAGAAEA